MTDLERKDWEIRIAIAEFCGYKWWSSWDGSWMSIDEDRFVYRAPGLSPGREHNRPVLYMDMRIPYYTSDLNSIHTAEKCLSDKSPGKDSSGEQIPSQLSRYRMNLCLETFMKGGPITATAEQRCSAFIKTISS